MKKTNDNDGPSGQSRNEMLSVIDIATLSNQEILKKLKEGASLDMILDDPLLLLKLKPGITAEDLEKATIIAEEFELAYENMDNDDSYNRGKFGPLHISPQLCMLLTEILAIKGKEEISEEQYLDIISTLRDTVRLGAFGKEKYKIVLLEKGQKIYRVGEPIKKDDEGNDLNPLGSFWTTHKISLHVNVLREKLALRRFWPVFYEWISGKKKMADNGKPIFKDFAKLTHCYTFEIKQDTYAIEGTLAGQGELYLGSDEKQYYIPVKDLIGKVELIDVEPLIGAEF